jgi:pimeloyl-ACP methyl ester carboxylesterase
MTEMTPGGSNGGPTVVLVHGAFADSSSWNEVIQQLQATGIEVVAVPNPLRGIAADTAYVASALQQVPGPVVAVGHSYGGAVISNAATNQANVVGLVYVAAFAPDQGEVLLEVEGNSKDSVLDTALVPQQYPTGQGDETAVEFRIDPGKFHDVFAADLPQERTAVLAAGQRSMAERAGATITEVEGSHVIMISQPRAVTDVILQAVSSSAAGSGR